MAKYMVLLNSTESAKDIMDRATADQIRASMAEWEQWRGEASKTAKVEFGLPLQAVGRLTADAVRSSDIPVSGYGIFESDSKERILKLLQTHPHLKRLGTSIDVLEMLPIPDQ